ncbi:MAG: aspartate/glutamate racemase family protein [Casimicrobium sp.]
MKRIALIHALQHSIEPINSAFIRHWPEALRVNILDDSLSADLAGNGGILDEAMHNRFETIADYAVKTGADGILFTCSAFGSCIERVATKHRNIPVLKPNEAMIAEAVAHGGPIGLIASFAPTLVSMPPEFPAGTDLCTALVSDAMDALDRGDIAHHDALVVAASRQLAAQGARVIALAQFSMARAASAVFAATGLPVLTTPDSGIRLLRARLDA